MAEMTPDEKAEYFARSFLAADGLWFLKAEERHGFEDALAIDEEVWKVLPKIQARMIKSMKGIENGLEGLCRALSHRLSLQKFVFKLEVDEESLRATVDFCPWQDLLVQSGRTHIAPRVGKVICSAENRCFAQEFDVHAFHHQSMICQGDSQCILVFRSR